MAPDDDRHVPNGTDRQKACTYVVYTSHAGSYYLVYGGALDRSAADDLMHADTDQGEAAHREIDALDRAEGALEFPSSPADLHDDDDPSSASSDDACASVASVRMVPTPTSSAPPYTTLSPWALCGYGLNICATSTRLLQLRWLPLPLQRRGSTSSPLLAAPWASPTSPLFFRLCATKTHVTLPGLLGTDSGILMSMESTATSWSISIGY